MLRPWLLVGLCAPLMAVGCASTIGDYPESDSSTTGVDRVSPGVDAVTPPPVDGSTPGTDVFVPPPVDVISPPPPDAGVDVILPPPDGGPTTLVGRWRVVGYDYTDQDTGMRASVSDTNRPVTMGGLTFDVRVNGLLTLAADRIALSFGVLVNDHFYLAADPMDPATTLSAYGYTVGGRLAGDTFTFPFGGAAPVTFERNLDGTISTSDMMGGTRTTFARFDSVLPPGALIARGQATRGTGVMTAPFAHPRVTLAWDRPGRMGGQIYDNDQTVAFDSLGGAGYDLALMAPPSGALATLGTTRVAVAYVVIYDDVNNNGRYDGAMSSDVIRGVSSIGIGYRDGDGSGAFARSVVRDLDQGFQLVHLHVDYTASRTGATPFDPTNPVAPDVAVAPGRSTTPIPDILR